MTDDLWRLILRGLFVWLLVDVLIAILWVFVMTRRPQ